MGTVDIMVYVFGIILGSLFFVSSILMLTGKKISLKTIGNIAIMFLVVAIIYFAMTLQ